MRWAALAVLALAGCSASPAQRALPDHSLPDRPTIVSLNPCTDAILAEVADPRQLLAISHYSHDPAASSMGAAQARRWPATSGSVEEVLALRPDVVVAGTFLPPATVAAFKRLGIELVQMPIASSVAQSQQQVRDLAQLAGQAPRGAALNRRIAAALDRASPPAGGQPVSALVWQSGGIVPGPDSLIAELLARTGFASHSAARGMKQADLLPLEQVLADPPQVLLVAGNPQAQEDRMLGHPALSALRSTRRFTLDPALLWCGGPTIERAAARLAEVRRGLHLAPPPPTPSSEEEGAFQDRGTLPLLFRGGGRGVVAPRKGQAG